MTVKQFEIWLVVNGYTQKALAERLEISGRTITEYKKLSRFPAMFLLALQALTTATQDK